MMSEYADTILIVSLTVSPLDTEELPALSNHSTFPPNDIIAEVKLSLVLVEGSKNSVPSILP